MLSLLLSSLSSHQIIFQNAPICRPVHSRSIYTTDTQHDMFACAHANCATFNFCSVLQSRSIREEFFIHDNSLGEAFFFHLVYRKFFSSARSPFSCSGCSRMFECFYAKTEGWESERTWTQRKWHWPVAIVELRLLYFFCRFFVASRIRFWANATREKNTEAQNSCYRRRPTTCIQITYYFYVVYNSTFSVFEFGRFSAFLLLCMINQLQLPTRLSSRFGALFFVVFGESVSSSSCVR